MDATASPTLESLLSLWPVASALSRHLPVGDLIALARLSVNLRTLLHGFERWEKRVVAQEPKAVRDELFIGHHDTPYWQGLKDRALVECSSRTHTKGLNPRPCRYCSKPICDACIVRSSFSRGHENTFQNRLRYLCPTCWETGNASKDQRFPLTPADPQAAKRNWYDPGGSSRDCCTCTLKDDGWLCLDCKDWQNSEAMASADSQCHGQGCTMPPGPEKERRRICLWCNRALPRVIGGTTRHHWNQKLVEARARHAASRQADLEEYNRKRLNLLRMSRREMRGDDAVRDDPEADLPQFVRHLDTINYRSFMSDSAAPDGVSVYDSKRGHWRYERTFLLKIGRRMQLHRYPPPPQLAACKHIQEQSMRFARTNSEKSHGIFVLASALPSLTPERREEWSQFKAVILERLLVQGLSYQTTQQLMREDSGFDASIQEYHTVLHAWYAQDQIGKMRRMSLEEEGEAAGGSEPGTATRDAVATRSRSMISEEDLSVLSRSRDTGNYLCRRSTSIDSTSSTGDDGPFDPDSGDDSDGDARGHFDSSTRPVQAPLTDNPPPPDRPPPDREIQHPGAVDVKTRDAGATEEHHDRQGDGEVEAENEPEPENENEDPPPYSPDGWEWS